MVLSIRRCFEINNMTALVSCFARYYHTKTDEAKIFDDPLAGEILSESEKNAIAENIKNGIANRSVCDAVLRFALYSALYALPMVQELEAEYFAWLRR